MDYTPQKKGSRLAGAEPTVVSIFCNVNKFPRTPDINHTTSTTEGLGKWKKLMKVEWKITGHAGNPKKGFEPRSPKIV